MTIIPEKNKRECMFYVVFFFTLFGVFTGKVSDVVFASLVGTAFTAYVAGRAYMEKKNDTETKP